MDVSGWSKLTSVDIYRYVTDALPKLNVFLIKNQADFSNTWGDAIVATFNSAKNAAECALEIRDQFRRGTQLDGISNGLTCRLSLHQGEVMLCENPVRRGKDIFGNAVHIAAHLEPATTPGQVFCTESFADALKEVSGLGPSATAPPS